MNKTLARVVLLLACATSSALSAQQPLNSTQRRALSAGAADRLARHDLLSILKPMGRYPRGMIRRVRSAGFSTPAYATDIPGLCAVDRLMLAYAPVRASDAQEAVPVRPYGLDVSHSYAFVQTPSIDMLRQNQDGPPSRWQTACDKADRDDRQRWFGVAEPELAVRGWLTFTAAVDALRAGRIAASPCAHSASRGQIDDCPTVLAALTLADLGGIEDCGTPDAVDRCYKIDIGSMWISITARPTDGAPMPGDIRSVKVEEYIIVT